MRIRQRRQLRQARFLKCGIEADIRGPAGGGARDAPCTQQVLLCSFDGGRLCIPFRERAHQGSLVSRRVQPVDPRPAFGRIDRPGGAKHQDRNAVAPGIEDGHGAVHQTHIAVQDRSQGLSRHLGIAMGHGHSVLFMKHQQHLGIIVPQMIDQAVMQAAKAGAWVEKHIGNAQRPQHVRDGIAAPIGFVRRRRDRLVAMQQTRWWVAHALVSVQRVIRT